jgi:TRAP-type C4-dicarboxylate transport system permease small subunit
MQDVLKATAVRKDNPLVSWVDKSLEYFVGMSVVTELVVLLANVITRSFFDSTILWANELGHLVLTIVAFIGGALAYNRNEHIAVHAVIDNLPKSWRPMLDAIVEWLVFAGSLFGAYLSVDIVESRREELSTVLEISMSWFVVPLTIGLV